MTCREVRELADSFLCDELLTETNHEILRHLDTCPSCRSEIDGRTRLRGALQAAFERAPDLQSRADFIVQLREQLRDAAMQANRSRVLSRRWFALAAGVVVAAGVTATLILSRLAVPSAAIARDAIGDHRDCALTFRLKETPISLEAAAQRFDRAYEVLLTAPPDGVSTPGGPVRVLERHSCVYGTRRFGHVVLRYRGHVVSLLMTASDGGGTGGAIPHILGRPTNGLSVVSVAGAHHAIILVADLDVEQLTQLSRTVSVPLAQKVAERVISTEHGRVAALYGSSLSATATSGTLSGVLTPSLR
jgi:anti-sigma factor RsiW